MSRPIHVFIHACQINHWQAILLEQFRCLERSGLMAKAEAVHLAIVGGQRKPPLPPKARVEVHHGDVKAFEFPGIQLVWDWAQKLPPDARLLYMHGKGLSRPNNRAMQNWRRYLLSWVVERHDAFLAATDEHDIAGVDFIQHGEWIAWKNGGGMVSQYTHFSGNHWWARADYFQRKIGRPVQSADRYQAEGWIMTGSPKWISLNQGVWRHWYGQP
jgi:hypothetical protein